MQYTYFNADPNIGKTMLMDINMDALALGVWAPAAEILLGWIYAAGLKQPTTSSPSGKRRISRFERLTEALTTKVEQQLNTGTASFEHLAEQRPSINLNGHTLESDVQFEGDNKPSANLNSSFIPNAAKSNSLVERPKLSKEEALERMLEHYRSNSGASYEEIGRAIGRSKGTVAIYTKELRERQRIRFTNGSVEVLS
jgi:hypothetical protein